MKTSIRACLALLLLLVGYLPTFAQQIETPPPLAKKVLELRGEKAAMGEVLFEPYLAEVLELSAPELERLHSTGRVDATIQLARLRWWNGDALTPIELLQEPAQKGIPVAQYLLGTYLRFKRRDMQTSMLWLTKASDAGHPAAQELLAGYYSDGSGGLPRNRPLSSRLYLAAARQGLANAQMNIGMMYCTGDGVERNNAQGVAWFMNSQKRSTKPFPPSAAGCQ